MIDLSTKHAPVTTLFEPLSSSHDPIRYRLTPDQIEFFHANGYLAGIRLLDDNQIAALRAHERARRVARCRLGRDWLP